MRESTMSRNTLETKLNGYINLDGTGKANINTGIGFFDHMLTLFAFHSKFDLNIEADGDLYVDDHHTIEDIGIMMGIERYGNFRLPMDETLCTCDLDISGRPYLVYNADLKREYIKDYSCEMTKEFLYALAVNAGITLHINVLYGDNDHHKVEAIFKALGRSLKAAVKVTSGEIQSSKGII